MGFLPPLDVIARVPLLPVMLWQGVKVRRRALVLPEAQGPLDGSVGEGPDLRVLIVGDSSAAGVGVDHQEQALAGQIVANLAPQFRVSWHLAAKIGATTRSALEMLKEDGAQQDQVFDVAVIALGVNDAVRLLPKWLWRKRHAALRNYLCQTYGVKLIVIPGVPPLRGFPALTPVLRWILGAHAVRLDEALEQDLRNDPICHHLVFDLPLTAESMARDGYHPNAASYAYCGQKAGGMIIDLYQGASDDS